MSERAIELYDYIEILLKFKWFIVVTTLICGGAGWLMRPATPPPSYEADAVLMIKNLPSQQEADATLTAHQTNGFYQALALADDLKQALSDTLGLGLSPRAMDDMLRVEILDPGVRLTVRTEDPEQTIDLVNTWAELFVDRNSDLNSEEGVKYYDYVTSQYDTAKARLELTEARMDSFAARNRIEFLQVQQATLDTAALNVYAGLVRTDLEIKQNGLELEMAEARVDQRQTQALLVDAADGTAGAASLERARQLFAKLEADRDAALNAFDREHDLRALDREIQRRRVRDAVDADSLRRLRRDLDLLELQIASTSEELERQKTAGTAKNQLILDALLQALAEFSRRQVTAKAQYDFAERVHRNEPADTARTDLGDLVAQHGRLAAHRKAIVDEFERRRAELSDQQTTLRRLHGVSLNSYMGNMIRRDSLKARMGILRRQQEALQTRLDTLQMDLNTIKDSLAAKLREQQRLLRDHSIYSETVGRFSKMSEEARVSREKAAGNIRVLTQALQVKRIDGIPGRQKAAIAAGVGLLISSLLSLLIEYVLNAKRRRATA